MKPKTKLSASRWRVAGAAETDGQPLRSAAPASAESQQARTAICYRALVESIPAITYSTILEADGHTVYVSPQLEAILGIETHDWISDPHTFLQAVHPEDCPRVQAELAASRERGEPFVCEYRMVARDGRVVWFRDTAVIVRDEDGRALCRQGVMLDVTESKRAQALFEESEAQLRTLVENAPEAVVVLDMDHGHFHHVNSNAARLFRRSRESLLKLSPADISPPRQPDGRASQKLIAEYLESALNGETPVFEWTHRDGDGTDIPCEVRLVRLPAEGRRLVRGSVTDLTERRRAEEVNARLGRILDHSSNEIFVFDAQSLRFQQVNRGACDNLGYTASELRRLTPLDLKPALTRAAFDKLLQPLRDGEQDLVSFETLHLRRDGSTYPVEARIQLLSSEQPPVFVAMILDITERRKTQRQMSRLSSALEQAADAVLITDAKGVIEYVNPAFEKITGFTPAEAIGQTPRILRSGNHDRQFFRRMWATILAGEVFRDVFVNRKRDGSLFYEEMTITPLTDERGQITSFIATGKDITERMRTQERLHYLAHHDMLTDLPNRALLMDRLEQGLRRARRRGSSLAVLFLDLDRFKTINDTLGHPIGDQTLRTVATRLTALLREGDTAARLGGDEFGIVLEDLTSREEASTLARRLGSSLCDDLTVEGRELFLSASIGISLFPEDGPDAETLLRNADVAMYRVKQQGRNGWQFYTADMNASAFDRLTLEAQLRRALAQNEFELHYQPLVDLATLRVTGVEALLRWQHPELGRLGPSRFIPILEETGLIVPVSEWVLRVACEQACRWHRQGAERLSIAVNLSSRLCGDRELVALVSSVLDDTGLAPELLQLELTESTVMAQASPTMSILKQLKTRGLSLAIDDFGTGYSSLTHLRELPVDTLKIDRSFVRDLTDDGDAAAIVSTILSMAESLKLRAVAEGVETVEQLDFLRRGGCPVAQGFLLATPQPAEELEQLLCSGEPVRVDGRGEQGGSAGSLTK